MDSKEAQEAIVTEETQNRLASFARRLKDLERQKKEISDHIKELKAGSIIKRIKILEQEKYEIDHIINTLLKDLDSMGIDKELVKEVISHMK